MRNKLKYWSLSVDVADKENCQVEELLMLCQEVLPAIDMKKIEKNKCFVELYTVRARTFPFFFFWQL